jgi:hypothetical protein
VQKTKLRKEGWVWQDRVEGRKEAPAPHTVVVAVLSPSEILKRLVRDVGGGSVRHVADPNRKLF